MPFRGSNVSFHYKEWKSFCKHHEARRDFWVVRSPLLHRRLFLGSFFLVGVRCRCNSISSGGIPCTDPDIVNLFLSAGLFFALDILPAGHTIWRVSIICTKTPRRHRGINSLGERMFTSSFEIVIFLDGNDNIPPPISNKNHF